MTKVFGFPESETEVLLKHFDDLMQIITTSLMKNPGLDRIWAVLQKDMEEQVPEIISFSADPKFQHPWERSSNTALKSNNRAEASLFALLRNCIGSMSSRVLMGSDLLECHPEILDDLWQVDKNIMSFIFSFPRFFPGMSAAYHSQTRLLHKMTEWHERMEAKSMKSDRFKDVSDLMKARQEVYSACSFSFRARASIDMSILWA